MFVCSQGINRSYLASKIAKEISQKRDLEINVNNCGIEYVLDFVKEGSDFFNYDKYFVMEEDMVSDLKKIGILEEKIICLNIKDDFLKDNILLRKILEEKLTNYF
ncbi:hypothetical protein KY334_03610 [Candidatus Woesearchaeota archaeon]|nr:hypothetical protein [Candidatus Woesearchaeota archaeon]